MGLCCGLCDACGSLSRIVILTLTAAGIILQGFTAFYQCNFLNVSIDDSYVDYLEGGSFGFFSYMLPGDENCTAYAEPGTGNTYKEPEADSIIRASGSMVIIALVAAFCAGSFVLFEFLCCKVCCAGCLEGLLYLLATICSALGYMAYASDACLADGDYIPTCTFGKGATLNALAMAAYAVASIVLACTPQPTPLFCKGK